MKLLNKVLLSSTDFFNLEGVANTPHYDPPLNDYELDRFYYLSSPEYDFKCELRLNYKSTVTLVCQTCEIQAQPVALKNHGGFMYCIRCGFKVIIKTRGNLTSRREQGPSSIYHSSADESYQFSFTWSEELERLFTEIFEAYHIDPLMNILFMYELKNLIIPIKGQLESKRITDTL